MMNRRTFFRSLTTAAAGLAAFCAAAHDLPSGGVHRFGDAHWQDMLADARAEGYKRGRAIEQAKAESRALAEEGG